VGDNDRLLARRASGFRTDIGRIACDILSTRGAGEFKFGHCSYVDSSVCQRQAGIEPIEVAKFTQFL
jgi:hypothetical protein